MSTNEKEPTQEPKPTPETTEDSAKGEKKAEASPETAAQGQAEEPAAETAKTEEKAEPERKDWFGKKAREAEALKAKLDAAEKKNNDMKERLLRTAAEYENFRKRSAREADQKFNDGVGYAVTQILSILDTLDMAANAACTDENYKKGVTMTLDKADKALETLGVTEIEALGKPFDPNLMSAVQQVSPEDGQESGSVVKVFQKGYRIGDKIVRHATVVVAE
jgi:molecular chaperone GrpE